MAKLTGTAGFAAPKAEKIFSRRRNAGVELFATAALAVSLIVAAAAVSIGVARARALGTASGGDNAPLAALLGTVMYRVSGLSALATRGPSPEATGLGPTSD